MPRLMGVDIPGRKRVGYALRYIHGVGPARARAVVASCKVDATKHADDLTPEEVRQITAFIQEHYRVEGDLRREVSQNIRRLISTGSYRGQRHRRGLPVRGQRTRTNARTRKGGKKTVSAVRDKAVRSAIKSSTPPTT
ncbi:MAG: 30S ribosomal protein S13 [Kiritimatiellae bacterium]|nr:30S ribosomal protein S13 [Kiritimatiellia bacterium]